MSTYTDILRDYVRRAHRAPRLSLEEEQQLISASLQGDEKSKKKLIESNIYLVLMITRRYQLSGEIMADILQEGHIGLIQAIDHFELERNLRLSTYAAWWIRRAIQDFLEKNHKHIRLPRNVQHSIRRIQDVYFLLYQQHGRAPTDQEISEYMQLSVKKITQITLHESKNPAESRPEEPESHSIENIVIDKSQQPEEQLLQQTLKEAVNDAVSTLTPLEREVLKLRFNPLQKHTLQSIGTTLNLNEYEVRKNLDNALQRIKKLTKDLR